MESPKYNEIKLFLFYCFLMKGNLPLRGSIPDMTSDSKRFIQLQNW